ncbi:MAG: DNA repair protein RecN [Cyclobacteriaceae bacterium]|nr:DNA repair protein RecN [Cyclobacteriaceae bacterium]
MLKSLVIRNYALIKNLELNPSASFSTITGETGAGKSIMLGALGLLLGNRADTRVLYENEEKCIVEAVFQIEGLDLEELFESLELDYTPETIMRREISASGKSRTFINDTPVTLEVMKTIGNYLIDVHSQRDTYLLGSPTYQLNIIDGLAKNAPILHEYRLAFKKYKELETLYQQLLETSDQLKKEADYNHFLYEELVKSRLSEGEQPALEEELSIIEHAEEIRARLFESAEMLDQGEMALLPALQKIIKNLQSVSQYAEHFVPMKERLHSAMLEVADIAREINNELQKIDYDSDRQSEIQERLSLLYLLLQKHQAATEKDLIAIRDSLKLKVEKVLNLDAELENARKSMTSSHEQMALIGAKLQQSRLAVVKGFKNGLETILRELAMPHASVEIRHANIPPSANGMDKFNILFSANIGVAPDELKNVASGGEFSRLMFGIKYLLTDFSALPTIVFDEIDTGISGEVAMKMAKMMKAMSSHHQVIVITHLPQIAASGDTHYFVFKENIGDRSVTKIRSLNVDEREVEIAKMISGDNPTQGALQSARELMAR